MTFRTDPITVAVAMGLLNPVALADDDADPCAESDDAHLARLRDIGQGAEIEQPFSADRAHFDRGGCNRPGGG